ncbi:MAG: type II toxin-antitoxin system HicB family antitoxin [candidate division SR1 bacterium]|nr:MAG: type II toxin-antitoxin system HicB family antitoxin [candidate division SR1 bacterium]
MQGKNFHIIIRQEGEYVIAKALENNVSSFGKDTISAMDNLKEALELYYEAEKEPLYQEIKSVALVDYQLENA